MPQRGYLSLMRRLFAWLFWAGWLAVALSAPAPMALIRSLQDDLGEFQELPVALIAPGGQPPETDDPLVRPLPWPTTDPSTWLPILDELSGL